MFERLLCPVCWRFVMKERKDVKTEVTAVKDGVPGKNAHYAIKCRGCKVELEIKKVS